MTYSIRQDDQRQEPRVEVEFPIRISIGTQLVLNGKLKNLSLKSAFFTMRTSVYHQINDEVGFSIQPSPENDTDLIEGLARISRIAKGEGMAIYFTKMSEASVSRLQSFLKNNA